MTGRARAKRVYTAALSGTGRVLDRARLLPATPPPRAARVRHWAYSLTRIHDVEGLIALDVPWWTYRAIDAVEAWLAGRPPARVFEYGSGASTLWLAGRAGEVHSVEHDRGFADALAPVLAGRPNVHLRVVEAQPADRPAVASGKEGYGGLDFAAYTAAIDAADGPFDLVVIDGRARAECLRRALAHLGPDGLVVFDNSRRRRYRAAIDGSGLVERRLAGLTPTLPYPEQTSLLIARRS